MENAAEIGSFCPAGLLPPLPAAALARLRESIRQHGVRVPIVVSAGPVRPGVVADGLARLALAAELGVECERELLPFATEAEFVLFRLEANLCRRQLSDADLARIGLLLEPLERQLAAARKAQAAGGKRGQKSLPVNRPEEKGETRERVAARLGLSPSVYTRAAKVLREGSPELVAAFEASKHSTNGAYNRLQAEQRRVRIRALAAEIERNPPLFPDGRVSVLGVDPPWPYGDGMLPYPTSALAQIAAIPIDRLLALDGIVWLWTTNRFIKDALRIAEDEWLLDLLNILTWDKGRGGNGHYLRGQTEHCLLLRRGNPLFIQGKYTNLIREAPRENSRKPEAFYKLVEDTCPGSKLELFARQQRPGWQAHGAETDYFPPLQPPAGEAPA
jgi:N6-adenosine-specific RNA methylase IME4